MGHSMSGDLISEKCPACPSRVSICDPFLGPYVATTKNQPHFLRGLKQSLSNENNLKDFPEGLFS